MGFAQRRLALGLWRALAQVLLRSFRPVFLTRRRKPTPRSCLSRLESSPLSRYQNMAPASSTVSLLSTTPLPPQPSDHRSFGELELSNHTPAGVRAYAVNPVASGGGFHLCYDGAVGVNLSDEPKLLAVNLVLSNGSQALTGHYLVDMLPQSDLPSEDEEHFVASGRQVIPLVRVSNLDPGGLLGVDHAPLMSVPLDALQHVGRPSDLSCDPPGVTPVSAVTAPPLAAAAAPAGPRRLCLSV